MKEFFSNLLKSVDGKKVYMVASVIVIQGLNMYFVDGQAFSAALDYILLGLGVAAARHTLAKLEEALGAKKQ